MLEPFKALRPAARLYIVLVVLLGTLVIGHSIHLLAVQPISYVWVIFASLALLTGSLNLRVPSINAHISISEAFVFASILLFGTASGVATVLLETMAILFWMKSTRTAHRTLFNIAAPTVAIWTAGTVFYAFPGVEPYSRTFTPLVILLPALFVCAATYFLLNSWLVAVALALENNRAASSIWWNNFAWHAVNHFSGASAAVLIVLYMHRLDFGTLAVIVPLLVVSYLTFRIAMGRAEDSYNHLAELNRLYLSTIETLAMAIDAKDQITHGHIRRVQTYAVGLAKQIGVSDEKLLKAIEAAALLHDMGKLCVPEHILNKPGRLTPAEFEKMKLHASVGADILSAINFPYPVVPIVRHHHESWDGTGYPDGIRGTDIPIGARILAVVDCFDALTSDRPYRPRLRDEAALAILLERRGSMYDPLVVDTFIRVHREIAPTESGTDAEPALRTPAASAQLPASPGAASSESLVENPGLFALVGALSGQRTLAGIADATARCFRPFVPFLLCVFYLYNEELDDLVAAHVVGEADHIVRDTRIANGEKLTGWVAANRKTIINSDPQLDLGTAARAAVPELRVSLSVPLIMGSELLGVLTLYGSSEYREEHRRFVESAAQHVSRSLHANTRPVAVSA